MNKNFNQIAIKICVSILLIETVILTIMGVFYVQSFGREIDQRVYEKLILPGILMSQRALNYDSVNNYLILEDLIQEKVLLAFITKKNGEIFYAADDLILGKKTDQLLSPEERLMLTDDDYTKNQYIVFKTRKGDHIRSILSQILYEDKPLGYLYIKIDATKIDREKRNIVLLFLLGSLLTIFLTTLFEALFIHRLFVPRVRKISTVLQMAKEGDLSTRVSFYGPKDELHTLIQLINSMLNTISKTINTLTGTKEALAASEKRFRELCDLLPEGVFEIDNHGYFTYVNLQLCKECQYSREEFYQKLHFTDLLVEEDHEKTSQDFQDRLNGRLTVFKEYEVRRKDGSIFPVMVNTSPIGQQEQVRGLRGVVVDLTEKNRLQKELWQAQKMESIGRLSASIAHEFGTPVVGIDYILRDIQHFSDLDESKKQIVVLGRKECQKMKNLIKNFLVFAKPSSNEKIYFDINQIVSDVLLLYRKYAADREIDIVANYQKNLPDILVSKDQIHQVLVNILMNAIDASHTGEKKIVITTLQRDKQVLIVIEDSGCGIEGDNLDNIFEPFYSTKPEVEGTGLGLYVAYHIMKNHNGVIHVDSTKGKGSVFTIGIPTED